MFTEDARVSHCCSQHFLVLFCSIYLLWFAALLPIDCCSGSWDLVWNLPNIVIWSSHNFHWGWLIVSVGIFCFYNFTVSLGLFNSVRMLSMVGQCLFPVTWWFRDIPKYWQTDGKWHEQGERKKQFTAAIPDTLLAQVRELAAIQHQEAPGTGAAGMTSRSGRTVHRK